eukprot:scaffold5101_cov403-Prasinococcus_capsulatus_cf.AAC.4
MQYVTNTPLAGSQLQLLFRPLPGAPGSILDFQEWPRRPGRRACQGGPDAAVQVQPRRSPTAAWPGRAASRRRMS